MKTDHKSIDRPNGYDSDQGKTQRADETKLNDVAAAQGSDRKSTEASQRETDEGGTSYTRDPSDRPKTEGPKGADKKKRSSSEPAPHEKTSGDASADISPRSI